MDLVKFRVWRISNFMCKILWYVLLCWTFILWITFNNKIHKNWSSKENGKTTVSILNFGVKGNLEFIYTLKSCSYLKNCWCYLISAVSLRRNFLARSWIVDYEWSSVVRQLSAELHVSYSNFDNYCPNKYCLMKKYWQN